jgi:hypothetical protein
VSGQVSSPAQMFGTITHQILPGFEDSSLCLKEEFAGSRIYQLYK